MALRLLSEDAYPREVTVQVYDQGGWKEIKFTANFRLLSKSRQEEILTNRAEDDADAALLAEIVAGWEGMQDLDGNAVPDNPENRQAVFDAPPYARALIQEYFRSMDGPGNSKMRRGTSRR